MRRSIDFCTIANFKDPTSSSTSSSSPLYAKETVAVWQKNLGDGDKEPAIQNSTSEPTNDKEGASEGADAEKEATGPGRGKGKRQERRFSASTAWSLLVVTLLAAS